jgi:hypothetical protein
VVDDGDTVPRTRQAADSGYGLHILEAFVAAWGVDRISGGGKVTWFDLETNPTPLDGS